MLTHKQLRAQALKRPEVTAEFEKQIEEFALLDEFLRARSEQGLTQAEVAERIGTTQVCCRENGIWPREALALPRNFVEVRRGTWLQVGGAPGP